MPDTVDGLEKKRVLSAIQALTERLVHIRDENGDFTLHTKGHAPVNDKEWESWGWPQGVGLYGLSQYYRLTQDAATLDLIRRWFDRRFAQGMVDKNVNSMAPFQAMILLYEDTKDPRYLPYIDAWLEWVIHDMPRTEEGGLQHITVATPNRQQLWVDTLMMTVMPLARGGRLLRRPAYEEEARRQFLLHIRYLADKKTGLWYHGWTFEGRHNFAGAFWGRGNCWATITLADYLEFLGLPQGDAFGDYLRAVLRSQIDALCRCQASSGLWHTVLDDPATYEEASATAGFAYGILKAVRRHYVDPSYQTVGIRAIRALLKQMAPDGTLEKVSTGTPVFQTATEYNQVGIGPMPYGQSLAIMALTEFLRLYI